jgi:uncharacterized protein
MFTTMTAVVLGTQSVSAHLPERMVAATLPSPKTTTWTRSRPEFSAVANGLSLLMPTLEPYIIKAVRIGARAEVVPQELRDDVSKFIRQEFSHQKAHRAFNEELTAQVPFLRHIEKAQRDFFRAAEQRISPLATLAFAAGAEAVAFFTARWVDRRRHSLLSDAEGAAASMFVWHLAEEAEHKNVAFDLYQAHGGGRARYLLGIISALMIMATSIVAASAVLLIRERSWWKPMTHIRLIGWSFSFVFEVVPLLGLCLRRDHHPSAWHNPEWLGVWLDEHDRAGGTAPAWSRDTVDGIFGPINLAAAS